MEHAELANKEIFKKQIEDEIKETKERGYSIVEEISVDISGVNESIKMFFELIKECDEKIHDTTNRLVELKNSNSYEFNKLKIELLDLELRRATLSELWYEDNYKLDLLSMNMNYHRGKMSLDNLYNEISKKRKEYYDANRYHTDKIFEKQQEFFFGRVEFTMDMLTKMQEVSTEEKNKEQDNLGKYIYDLEAFINNMESGEIKTQAKNRYENLVNKLGKKENKMDILQQQTKVDNSKQVDEIINQEKENENATQSMSNRILKIKKVERTLSDERKKKNIFAVLSGVCFAGLMSAIHFSGVDVNQAIQTEFQALNSFDALKDYLATFTPAMWGTMAATAVSMSKYIKHRKKYKNVEEKLADMEEISGKVI